MKNFSIFEYTLFNNTTPKLVVENIDEELRRGLSFSISKYKENIVKLNGKCKAWSKVELHKNNKITIFIEDSFFNKNCIIDQILTSLWANLLDFAEIKLNNFKLSEKIHNMLLHNVKKTKKSSQKISFIDRPYLGTIIKPSFLYSPKEKIDIAKKVSSNGFKFIKEDETYLVEKSKIIEESKIIQSALNNFPHPCFYIPNVTSHVYDKKFLNELYNNGIRIVMINYLILGLPTVNKIINRHNNLLFWGHRVGFKPIEKYISMEVIALLATYSGFDMLHIGTPYFSNKEMVDKKKKILRGMKKINEKIVPVFTKCSTDISPSLINNFSKNIALMFCGSIRTKGVIDPFKVKKIGETFDYD